MNWDGRGHKHSGHSEVVLLSCLVTLCLIFWETISYNGCIILYTLQYSSWVLQFLYFLTNTCYFLVFFFFVQPFILVCVKWYLIMVFICLSLLTNDTEHLFMCLLTTYMSLVVEVQFVIFPFVIHILVFLSKKLRFTPRLQRSSPLFSSRSFIVLDFTFMSVIQFDFILKKELILIFSYSYM